MYGTVLSGTLLALFLCCPAISLAAQTCRPADIVASTPTSRFVINGDMTVTDTITKLTWKRCSEGQSGGACELGTATTHTLPAALQLATTSTFTGKNDWRLPTIKELATILEYQCTMPAINTAVFPATPATNFWSSSRYAGYSDGGWNINFNDGVHDSCSKNFSLYVRLVRGGQ
jgi:hypothetical protein